MSEELRARARNVWACEGAIRYREQALEIVTLSSEDRAEHELQLAEYLKRLADLLRREEVEPEAECERCTSLHDYFELAEEPSQVAHAHMADHPGAFCLVCGNLGAHPWHEDAPLLSDLQEIRKYLATMGFRMVRETVE